MTEEKERSEVSEQIRFVGERAEKAIAKGESIFIGEVERVWVRGLVERQGVDTSKVEGPTNLSEQVDGLMSAMGVGESIQFVSKLASKMVRSADSEEVGRFVEEFLLKKIDGKVEFSTKKYKGWQKKVVQRMEAIVATANKLMWIVGADDVDEGVRRQGTEGIKKHIRERVLRGLEIAGVEIDGSVPRYKAKNQKQDKLRVLHAGEMGMVLEALVGL